MYLATRFCGLFLALAFVLSATAQESGEKRAGEDSASAQKGLKNSAENCYHVDALNDGVPKVSNPPDLTTPLATVENFIFACRDEDFARAAQSLNFQLIPKDQREQAAELARQFYYTLNQRLWIDIEDLPDRPDGQMISRLGNDDPLAGQPRRSIRLGVIHIGDWNEVRVRVQRVQAGDAKPVWLFSPQTVEKIPALYAEYGPNWIEQQMPEWAKTRTAGKVPIWEWGVLLIFVATAILVGYLTQLVLGATILHRQQKERLWLERLVDALAKPVVCASATFTLYLLKISFLSLTAPVNAVLDPLLLLTVVGSVAWMILQGLDVAMNFIMDHYVNGLDDEKEGVQEGLVTKISVGRRIVTMIAVLAALGIVLIQLNLFDAVGYGLLASAGVTTVILGIAAQPILGNFLASLQIGLAQPVRIGDSVLFEGNWGHVEDIKFTYLTIRTWDKRRLIVPLQYLLSKPIENWTKISEDLSKPIKLYVDYTIDVQKVRDKFCELATQHELWDEDCEPMVQVTGCSEATMEVRAVCHAKSPADAWNLHCELREKMIAYVQQLESGQYLPKERIRMVEETRQNEGEQP